jgi:hypothetical protein
MASGMLKVRCGQNGPVPRVGEKPHMGEGGRLANFIYPDEGIVEVPNIRYYRRRIEAKDLELAEAVEE